MTKSRIRIYVLVALNMFGALAFFWPFVLPAGIGSEAAHDADAPFILLGLLALLGGLLFVELGRRGMGPKVVALIGVLGAAMVALRLPGFIAGFSAMFIIVLVAGNAFGPGFGFLLGAVGMFASGLFVGGLGPWLPFQMVAVGWMGMGAGLLPKQPQRSRILWLAAYGFVTGYVFGAIMNLWTWPFLTAGTEISWSPGAGTVENLRHYFTFYAATSFVWDTFRAIGNAAMVLILGKPLLSALDRAARRMNLQVAPSS
ncbi:MAG: ECF transporter S component [Actinomycetota bacterium]